MPYKPTNKGNTNANKKVERQGVDVDEWNRKSKGKSCPKEEKREKKEMKGNSNMDTEELKKYLTQIS